MIAAVLCAVVIAGALARAFRTFRTITLWGLTSPLWPPRCRLGWWIVRVALLGGLVIIGSADWWAGRSACLPAVLPACLMTCLPASRLPAAMLAELLVWLVFVGWLVG